MKVKQEIPNLYHFVFLGFTPFMYTHYLAIVTCLIVQKPDILYLYTHHSPQSQWWDKLTQHPLFQVVNQEQVSLPQHIFGNPIEKYQHMADVIRLEKLIERGGVYLDLDVISLRNLDTIRQNPIHINKGCVMGIQTPNTKFMGLCNAVILAKPQSLFLQRWYKEYKSFRKTRWDYHSVKLPYILSQLIPRQIQSLASRFFFPISWEEPSFMENTSLNHKVSNSFLVHIWHSEWSKTVLKNEGPWLLQKRSTFAEQVKRILRTFESSQNPPSKAPYFPIIKKTKNQKKSPSIPNIKHNKHNPKIDTSKTSNASDTSDTSALIVKQIIPLEKTPNEKAIPEKKPEKIIPQQDLFTRDPERIRQVQLNRIEKGFQELEIPLPVFSDETLFIQKIKSSYNLHFLSSTQGLSVPSTFIKSIYSEKECQTHFYEKLSSFPHCLYPIQENMYLYPDFNKYQEFAWCHPSQKKLITISLKECIAKLLQRCFRVSRQEPITSVSLHTTAHEALHILNHSFPEISFIMIRKQEKKYWIACQVASTRHPLTQLTLPRTLHLFLLVPHQIVSSSLAIIYQQKCIGFVGKDVILPTRSSESSIFVTPRFPKIIQSLFKF